ncbi:MAG: flavodoxin family protein [Atopobiaceae bacterium]|nr:flavodoxin family protein [Atopobiaceae bacterium]
MKVLIINGSPHATGNTARALAEMQKIFTEEGVEVVTARVGSMDVRGCIGCGRCSQLGRCVFDDVVNELAPKFQEADGLVVASPVYYGSANATLIATLDRLFYSSSFDKTMKVGAAVSVARRGGLTATWDELNKYFGISGMPIATGQYWNGVHGAAPGEAEKDLEGLQQMRTLARNMVFLMRGVALARESYGIPTREPFERTNFVR